ncbi:Panacea domain-containing protein [Deinococcus saxicola]|uniref:Panacea domain-containing protein n=1 Tax=Deinococcus saxicola TaxID=249406 RepID=UPI0039EE29F8
MTNFAYPIEKIANKFIELAAEQGRLLTHLQLQKLIYFAHGLSLGLNSRRLVANNFHAWPYGPVSPQLYDELKIYRDRAIDKPLEDPMPELDLDDEANRVVKDIFKVYGHHSGFKLRDISHVSGSPWSEIDSREKYGVIPDSLTETYYKKVLKG